MRNVALAFFVGMIAGWSLYSTNLKEKFTNDGKLEVTIQYTTGRGKIALDAQRVLKETHKDVWVQSGVVDDVLIRTGLDVYRMSSIAPMLAANFTVQNIVYFVRSSSSVAPLHHA